ncbi:hypothetical protein QTJ16_006870 [Diplocarpon rosae]|uniref:Uncharacterized protein n=1 Tax=Diplocarpon rosae TaxID=946125 RepID=A0AAD9WCD5_9HELO|nr:hypothetical protein QTJ16_006870 [Diplocarpon rosae]
MVLKRKLSDSEISTSSSHFSPLSASNGMSIDLPYHSPIATPSLFASRTRKRHRDNRPSDSEVHQHTLSLLFSAQQKPPHAALPTSFRPSQSHRQDPVSSVPSSSQSSQQSSLYSFWHGPMASSTRTRQCSPSSSCTPSPVTTPSASLHMTSMFPATHCEDCDASLGHPGDGYAMDVDMMDVDLGISESYGCVACGKQVCHSCSVSNLGAERRCLNCAGRKISQGVFGFVRR